MNILTNINLNGNEAQGVRLQNLATAPSNPTSGMIYYDTSIGTARIYTGTEWLNVGGGEGTTYTFEEGIQNGTFIVTPSTGTAQTITIHGLADAAYKAVDTTIASGTTSTNVPTSAAVETRITEVVSAINAMTYKGTVGAGGTVNTLPTTGVKIGDTYKVCVAGTYAGQAAQIGDLFIATSTTPEWSYVPSGDDGNVNKYTAANPSLTVSGGACTWSVTHGLGTKFVDVSLFELASGEKVIADVELVSTSALNIIINSATNISADTYQVVVHG